MSLKPGVAELLKKVLKVVAFILFLFLVYLVVSYFLGLDKRVSSLEARPALIREVKVEVTATPSATPTRRPIFRSVSPVPTD